MSVENPAPGRWIAVVEGFEVPGGTTAYDYTDLFVTPSLGNVVIDDTDTLRPTGTAWNVSGTVTTLAAPPVCRELNGELVVRTSDSGITGGVLSRSTP